MLEISAISNPSSISFPNTGGIAVSSHALAAIFHIPKHQELGRRLGDLIDLIPNGFIKKSQESDGMIHHGHPTIFDKE